MPGYSRTQLTQAETLFDEETFKDIEQLVEPGVSVELGARALALHNMMATYNQLNKAEGARKAHRVPGNLFDTRFARPEEVLESMGSKAARMIHDNHEDLRTLNATDELADSGLYTHAQAESQERLLARALSDRYGPGKVRAPERDKMVRKASRAAQAGTSTLRKA